MTSTPVGQRCHNIKVTTLGAEATGKTSLLRRYLDGHFQDNSPATIGAAFFVKKVIYQDEVLKLQIWDTAGQERFRALIPMYLRGVDVVIVCVDLTTIDVKDILKLIQLVELHILPENKESILVAFTKHDLLARCDATLIKKAREIFDNTGWVQVMTSAKTGTGMELLADHIREAGYHAVTHRSPPHDVCISLQGEDELEAKETGCCG